MVSPWSGVASWLCATPEQLDWVLQKMFTQLLSLVLPLAWLHILSRSIYLYLQVKSENELDVLSILPNGWQPDEPLQPRPYLLVPSTRVTFLARQYRFVIELDLSPSTGIVVSAETAPLGCSVWKGWTHFCLLGRLVPLVLVLTFAEFLLFPRRRHAMLLLGSLRADSVTLLSAQCMTCV